MELIQKTIRYNQEGKKHLTSFIWTKITMFRMQSRMCGVSSRDRELSRSRMSSWWKLCADFRKAVFPDFVCDGSGRADAGSTGWQDSV